MRFRLYPVIIVKINGIGIIDVLYVNMYRNAKVHK